MVLRHRETQKRPNEAQRGSMRQRLVEAQRDPKGAHEAQRDPEEVKRLADWLILSY